MSDGPDTRLARGETVLKEGYAGLGAGSRGRTFAPGRMFLTDRRLLIESRLEADRTALAYALSAITGLHPLPDGFEMALETGITETVIVWGEAAAWVTAIEEARQSAPTLAQSVTDRQQSTPSNRRRRAVISIAVALLVIVLALIIVCLLAGAFTLMGGSG